MSSNLLLLAIQFSQNRSKLSNKTVSVKLQTLAFSYHPPTHAYTFETTNVLYHVQVGYVVILLIHNSHTMYVTTQSTTDQPM